MLNGTQWFESHYKSNITKSKWWKLCNLFIIPPLARDWAVGYTPNLDSFSTDLTSTTYQNQMTKIMGRQKEIKEIELILLKSQEANVMIVGEEGVGKHSIIDALAKNMYEGKTNISLMYKRILSLNMEKILNIYTDQIQRENFLENLFYEAADSKSVILLIENIESYINPHNGGIDLSKSIEKFARSSVIQIMGITTPFLYEKYIANNDKIFRLFTKIDVEEISKNEAIKILLESVFHFEYIYNVIIPYEIILSIIDKTDYYITNIPFPEKAIDLLDNICVFVSENNKHIKQYPIITFEDIDVVLTNNTHIPTTLTTNMRNKLITLENSLSNEIIQQDHAIHSVASGLRRSFILIGKRKKPLASFLFLGPTGVGKTQTAKAITNSFFDEKHLIRFDMSLYQSKLDIPKLIGSMESGDPGLLTSAIRENPYGVLLLDEIEKADKDLINIFLTILDEGYFTDGQGKKIDCKMLVIIATSNAGSSHLFSLLHNNGNVEMSLVEYLIQKGIFSPEFLNRFDGVIVYKPLSQVAAIEIAKQKLVKIEKDIMSIYKIKLVVSDEKLTELAQKGYDEKFGARNMERLIREEIEDKVALQILEKKVTEGDIITI
ncbi:MAG: AAA family ATPase [bacterium]|nr:AAA family ATPase [bacterium]